MRVQNGCEYVVLEGSILDPKITSNESSIRKSRKEHADSLSEDGMVVIRDITFNTPSGAANFIRGGACNGKTYWRTESDRPLSEFISYRKNDSYNWYIRAFLKPCGLCLFAPISDFARTGQIWRIGAKIEKHLSVTKNMRLYEAGKSIIRVKTGAQIKKTPRKIGGFSHAALA